ncbi:MAG TPA: hypothetical protein VFN23_06790 [Ktedonobacteraceae bacterium]|nr:hypothetical protein [Ktedonobacteraceae bacterium]
MNALSATFSRRKLVSTSLLRRSSVRGAGLLLAFTLGLLLLSACSSTNQGATNVNGATPDVALNQLSWCDKPFIVFSDLQHAGATATATPSVLPTLDTSNGTPVPTNVPTITNWPKVKPLLNFTTYLPQMLPQGSCLVSVTGTVHDPIFGSSFTISYLLPDHSSVNVAEAPLRAQNPEFQCSPSTTASSSTKATPKAQTGSVSQIQLCSGAKDKTSITLSAVGSDKFVTQFYNGLKADVNWVPATTK